MERRHFVSFFKRCFVITCIAFTLAPASAHAADKTTVQNIRAAINFATDKGWCTTKDLSKGDCKKRQIICDSQEWSEFIADNVEFTPGGGVLQKKGIGDLGLAARTLLGVGVSEIAVRKAAGERLTDAELLPGGVYDYLRKDPRNRNRIIPFTEASCFCECSQNDTDNRCVGRDPGTPIRIRPDEYFTREECMDACSRTDRKMAEKCAGSLAPIESIDISSSEGQRAAQSAQLAAGINALCFSREQCGEQNGIWEAWENCKSGKGRCYAKEPEITLNTPIGGVTKIQGINTYIVTVFRYMISIIAVTTAIMFIYGAFQYLIGSAIETINKGKKVMVDAVVGMLLILGSVTILRTINPELLTLNPIKVYMINTVQFVEAAYCSELDEDLRLADAGVPPSLKSFEDVSSKEGAFSVSPKRAACGHKYYVKGSIGEPCEGDYCEKSGEVCISCADASIPECQNIAGTRKVCANLEFAGTINYAEGRFPEEVYLLRVCGWADGTTREAARDNLEVVEEVDLERVVQIMGTVKTTKDISGQATYIIDLDSSDLEEAANSCEPKPQNGLRGFLLGVQYNDDKKLGERYLVAPVSGQPAYIQDDMAILSKNNCGGDTGTFDAYATGASAPDQWDLARALLCGFAKGKLKNPQTEFWTLDELKAAATGQSPITCNFNLSEENAPSNPGEKSPFCPADKSGIWRLDWDESKVQANSCEHGNPCIVEYKKMSG